jgi:hypothetical protein
MARRTPSNKTAGAVVTPIESQGDLVEVALPRARKWVPEGTNKSVTYPAGLQRIPRAMAEGLGLIAPLATDDPTADDGDKAEGDE